MTIREIKTLLKGFEGEPLSLVLPDEAVVPAHFHVTEVGYVKKEFIDCGGEVRIDEKCLLQIWVADDVDHRVDAGKFLEILEHGKTIIPSEDLSVEIEYEHPYVSQFALSEVRSNADAVSLIFVSKHTDCLAKDVCGVTFDEGDSCCSPRTGCC